jgi:ABC-2 type transport system permease protein
MNDMSNPIGTRRFGRVNWLGVRTLAGREAMRFMSIWTQTVGAPLMTAGLFLTVFTLAIGPTRGDVMGVPFLAFLTPGILMMTVIQNSFANTSSSIMSAKVQGNIVDTLMPPLSAGELLAGYLAGGIARGMLVAVVIGTVLIVLLGVPFVYPIWALIFALLGAAFMGSLGIIAAIYATKFDQMAAITNFIITPLSFLSGTFYSTQTLPDAMRIITHLNPVFYLIDGVRYGMLGVSDSSPWLGLLVCLAATAATSFTAWKWFKSGYRLKS